MSLSRVWGASALLLACCASAWADGPAVEAPAYAPPGCAACENGTCPTGNCGKRCCCPKYVFAIEKPPRICYKGICPKPLCNPCDLENFGYFATCWHPWPYPPNYEACVVPPPGVLASAPPPLIGGVPGPASPGPSHDEALPPPQKAANPNPNR